MAEKKPNTILEDANPGRPEGEEGLKMIQRMNESHSPLRDFGFQYITWHSGMKILDLGCGGGATISEMLTLSKDGIVYGLDYMPTCVEQSKRMNQEFLGSRCEIFQGDVARLPFEKESFDLVTAVETVYFWPDIEKAFAQAYDVTKKDGTFAIFCEANDPDHYDWPKPQGIHFRVYRPEELKDYLLKAGFKEVTYHNGPGQYVAVFGKK